jgi:hypothetical protein
MEEDVFDNVPRNPRAVHSLSVYVPAMACKHPPAFLTRYTDTCGQVTFNHFANFLQSPDGRRDVLSLPATREILESNTASEEIIFRLVEQILQPSPKASVTGSVPPNSLKHSM